MSTREPILIGDVAPHGVPAITGVEVSFRALELVAHWKRCGLTADWLAGFLSYDFDLETRTVAANVLATVINELIENAAKFCADKSAPVAIAVRHHGDFVRIETRNGADAARVEKLRRALDELAGADLPALFAQRIEQPASPSASGLGLLILRKDYAARVGATLRETGDGTWEVHMQVTLDGEEVAGG